MSTAQFMTVLNKAWPLYEKEYNSTNYAFMCCCISDLHTNCDITEWQCENALIKIDSIINNRLTLASTLIRKYKASYLHRHAAAYEFWNSLIQYYNYFGDMPPTHLVIERLKISHPQYFVDGK